MTWMFIKRSTPSRGSACKSDGGDHHGRRKEIPVMAVVAPALSREWGIGPVRVG